MIPVNYIIPYHGPTIIRNLLKLACKTYKKVMTSHHFTPSLHSPTIVKVFRTNCMPVFPYTCVKKYEKIRQPYCYSHSPGLFALHSPTSLLFPYIDWHYYKICCTEALILMDQVAIVKVLGWLVCLYSPRVTLKSTKVWPPYFQQSILRIVFILHSSRTVICFHCALHLLSEWLFSLSNSHSLTEN